VACRAAIFVVMGTVSAGTSQQMPAARLCDADYAWLFRREGDIYRWAASYGHSNDDYERAKQYMLALTA
jgi:hypothetical protein